MSKHFTKFILLLVLSTNIYAVENDKELQELKRQVNELLKRINAYEAKRNLEKAEKQESVQTNTQDVVAKVPPPKQKGTLELKSADTTIGIGGKIELQTTYAWPQGSFLAGKIPMSKTGENGKLSMNARDSRLWVKTRTPSKYGPVRTLVEIDFWGSNDANERTTNSYGPRLRHAYVQAAGFTVGQTNSVFNAFVVMDTITDSLNYTLVRQPLISYSIDDGEFGYDFSLEQPETTLLDKDGVIITPGDDVLPDIVTRARYYSYWGEAAIAFMGRYIAQDHATLSDTTTLNNSDSAIGWATNMSAKINVFTLDDIRVDAQYGMGLGRYLAYNAYAAGSVDANGNIKLQPSYGAHLGYLHWWNKELKSTLGIAYSATQNNLSGVGSLDTITKEAYSIQANLFWIPITNALVGVEYSKGVRTVETNEKGDMDTATMLLRYNF